MTKRKASLTPLGKALRDLQSHREHDYSEPIKAACSGDATRLVNLLRAHRRPVTADALTNDDLDQLADFIDMTTKRKRGRERNEAVHEAAQLADIIMHMGKAEKRQWKAIRPTGEETVPTAWAYSDTRRASDTERTAAIKIACKQIERERGVVVEPEQVRDLLSRPKKRRQPKTSP